ncbi:Dabb family protein [Desulfovibrio sp. SGI.169]|uniref:Dabb family protein n=1 Tax=Desulfovibrio sp. SGI.169 TaxID=3420561 RepID=UPI003CFF629E
MIRHIVWWTLQEEADGHSAAENARRIKEASASLCGIPTVRSVEVSYQIQPTSTTPAQVVLQSAHDDMDGLKAYAEHPIHLEFGRLVKAVSASRQALDYAI